MMTTATKGTKGTKATKAPTGKSAFAFFPFFALVAFFAFFASVTYAAFDNYGAGARAPGMGNAFTAVADDINSIFYNPAGLGSLRRPQFTSAYSRLLMGLSDDSNLGLSQLAYVQPLKSGRFGSIGAAWQNFSLSEIYNEQSFYLSYGRMIDLHQHRPALGRLFLGVNAKYLKRSFTRLPESYNALNQNFKQIGQPDPVLMGDNVKSVMDADIGVLYQAPQHYSIGLVIEHLNQPDVAFSSSDENRLARRVKIGLGYKRLWTNITSEMQIQRSPTGEIDKDFIFGIERYFPTLRSGQFGVRGSFGFGSRKFRQATFGLSYRISKIQVDYAFLMPLWSIRNTIGTHRLALTFHFGAPDAEKIYELEELPEEEAAAPEVEFAFKPPEPPPARLKAEPPVTLNVQKAQNCDTSVIDLAPAMMKKHKGKDAGAWTILKTEGGFALCLFSNRYLAFSQSLESLVSVAVENEDFVITVDGPQKQFGCTYFVNARNLIAKSPLYMGYPVEKADWARVTYDAASRMPLELKLAQSRTRFAAREFQRASKLYQEILDAEPGQVRALERLGLAYYNQGKFTQALNVWRRALNAEKDPEKIRELENYIRQAKEKLKPKKIKRPPEKAPRARPDPREIERLYQQGVELYAAEKFKEASRAFRNILKLDPENAQAERALRWLEGK